MRRYLVLSALIAVCGVSIILWNRADTLPPHQDEARHLLASLHYFRDLARPLPERLGNLLYARCETYPPLVYVATIPLYAVWGTGMDVAAAVNVIFTAILILSVYGIGRRLYSDAVGLTAAVLVSCYPIIVGLSRLYVLEVPEAAMVALAVYAALRTERFGKAGRSVLLGLCFGLGMLVKWHFFVFSAAPIILLLTASPGRMLLSPPRKTRVMNVLLAILAALAVAGPWYAHNYGKAMGFVLTNISPGYAEAPPPVFSLNSVLFFPYALADTMILVPMLVLFLVGLAVACARKRASLLLLLWMAVPFLVMVFVKPKLPRYYTPVLPAIALLTAAGISAIRTAWFRRALYALAFGVSAVNFFLLTVPFPPGGISLCAPIPFYDSRYDSWFAFRACFLRSELPSYGMGPPRAERWGIEGILRDVVAFGRGGEGHPVSLGWFIFPHIRFHRYAIYYYAELEREPIRCVAPDRAQFLLTRLTTGDQKRRLAAWARPWLHLRELRRYRLPDGSRAVLYRTSLTRRRRYKAHTLPLETGERVVAESESSDGWARYADRDSSAPGVLVKGPMHPLPAGGFRVDVRMKYERPDGREPIAEIEISSGARRRRLVRLTLTQRQLGGAGAFRTVGVDFRMPLRDRVDIRVLHTGHADLWIDTIGITPLAGGSK